MVREVGTIHRVVCIQSLLCDMSDESRRLALAIEFDSTVN